MYRTILAHLNSSRSADAITDVASMIAEKHGAHIIGVHNSRHMAVDSRGRPDLEAPLQQADAIQQIFEKAVEARQLSHEWQHRELSESESAADVLGRAMSADLVVAGGRSLSDPSGQWYNLPIRIVMEAGRPVLLVPGEARLGSFGKRITIAWNRTRESARAVFDALPLLKGADTVRLLSINGVTNGTLGPDDGLPAMLQRHGVRVEPVSTETTDTPGEELLADVADTHADLLVMGCFGRPRLLEMVLGGMTRHVLGHSPVPVFLAH